MFTRDVKSSKFTCGKIFIFIQLLSLCSFFQPPFSWYLHNPCSVLNAIWRVYGMSCCLSWHALSPSSNISISLYQISITGSTMASRDVANRAQVYVLARLGWSKAAIAHERRCSMRFVRKWCSGDLHLASLVDAPRSGRPPKATKAVCAKVRRMIENKRYTGIARLMKLYSVRALTSRAGPCSESLKLLR